MTDRTPSEPKSLVELKARKVAKAAAASDSLQDRISEAFGQARGPTIASASGQRSDEADAAGVLTAIDEDPEGGEEAECPREFDYHTDAEEE